MVLFKIAFSGMKGRKKDTLLLFLVVILSFAFIVSATMFYAGIAGTEEKNRLKTYGRWQAAYMSGDKQMVEYFKSSKDVEIVSANAIVDRNTSAGIIGTADENFLELGNVSMASGVMPQKDNEIAIELSKATEMGLREEDIGKEILITGEMVVSLTQQPEIDEYLNYQHERYSDIDKLSSYEASNVRPVNKSKDTIISYRDRYMYCGPTLMNQDDIIKGGIMTSQSFLIYKYYVLTGFVETYSDRWDKGSYPLANAFITQSSADKYLEDLKVCVVPGDKEGSVYEHSMSYNIFLYSDSVGEGLYSHLSGDVEKYIEEKGEGSSGISAALGENEASSAAFRKNSLAYPGNINQQKTRLIYTVMGAIFLVSAISIFQLYLTQVRRRARTYSLLKSIGSTNKQIINTFLYENLITLVICMPIGVGAGIGLSTLAAKISSMAGGVLMIGFIPSLVLTGIGACCISLLAGMIFPMVYALGIPLTGVIEKPIKHTSQKKDEKVSERLIQNPSVGCTLRMINTIHARLNRGKSAMAFAMSLATCMLMLFSILIGYVCHDKYIDQVLDKGKPDYVAEVLYGTSSIGNSGRAAVMELLSRARGITDVERMWKGNGLHLYYDGINEDKVVNTFKESLPERYKSDYFGGQDGEYGIKEVDNAIITNFYAPDICVVDNGYLVYKDTGKKYRRDIKVEEDQSLLEWISNKECIYGNGAMKLIDSITEGAFNEEEFTGGQEVILLMPMYSSLNKNDNADISSVIGESTFQATMSNVLEAAGKYRFSFDKADKDTMNKNEALKVGDSIWICADEEKVVGETLIHIYNPRQVKVGAIIRYFPGESPWPFADTKQSYGVIGSVVLMRELYKGFDTSDIEKMDKNAIKLLNETISKVKLGRTLYYVYGNNSIDYEHTDNRITELGELNGFVLTNYRISNQVMKSEAKNNTAITALLCITSAALAMIILYNILSSRAEQEKKRIGILQSIGVTRSQLRKVNLRTGIRNGAFSIAITYFVMAVAVFVLATVYAPSTGITSAIYLDRLKRYYPIWLLVGVTVFYLAATVIMYSLPFRRIIKNSPVENITE